MITIYQIYKNNLLRTRSGKPWDIPRISRLAKRLGAKYARTPHGWSLAIDELLLADLIHYANEATTHKGPLPKG